MVNLWSCIKDKFALKWYPCIFILITRNREQKTVLEQLFSLQWTTLTITFEFPMTWKHFSAFLSEVTQHDRAPLTQTPTWIPQYNDALGQPAKIVALHASFQNACHVCVTTRETVEHNRQSSILNFYFLTHPTNTDAEYFTCNIWRYSCVNFYTHEKGSPGKENLTS